MSYQVRALMDKKAFVERLKNKGWNRAEIVMVYPFITLHCASRVKKTTTVHPKLLSLTDGQLENLMSLLHTEPNVDQISQLLNVKTEEVEELGKVIRRLMFLKDNWRVDSIKLALINRYFKEGLSANHVAQRVRLPRDTIYAYSREVYFARNFDVPSEE